MKTLRESLQDRILLLDGAMGSLIQTYGLKEEDFQGKLELAEGTRVQGNNDLLNLTRPDIISDIHRRYLEAGADIVTANTFNSQRISQAEYHCGHLVRQLNAEAVRLARQQAKTFSTADKPRYVIATMGPTGKSLSISPDVNDPAYRSISYDELRDAYTEQATALLESGVDAILVETVFDTLNAKAALDAAVSAMHTTDITVPLMLSITVNDRYGRILSGQTIEALLASISHFELLSVGLNCSFGAEDMLPSLRTLASIAPYYITAHPNAGLPNAMGQYDQTPPVMAAQMQQFVNEGLANIIGGCCGTTPEHIAAMLPLTALNKPHIPVTKKALGYSIQLSGLEPLVTKNGENIFINVGERCNVAGSRKFLRLIKEKAYEEALETARKQVQDGAMVLDINMDDGLIDACEEMKHFLHLIGSEPEICRVPLMIDSSNWDVIRTALKCVQGKCIVNSISLKEGEDMFLSHAREIKRMGAAVVVMAFDEKGQADTYERRIEVCQRAYRLLTDKAGMCPNDIIFDPNILAVATGMAEHDTYALDFIKATEWIRKNLPGAHVSGGVSNLSFSFRGNNYLREALHAVFLYHARNAGMDMAIVNPSAQVMYADIPQEQLKILEGVVLHPGPQATEKLIDLAGRLQAQQEANHSKTPDSTNPCSHTLSAEERIIHDILQGCTVRLEQDLKDALAQHSKAVDIIEGPLMKGMNIVGERFGEGKMFLPQVVKAARTMKQAVTVLQPYLGADNEKTTNRKGKILLATVKGDVHDIGKNIVSVVMACNGYEIADLGVMVPAETIVAEAMVQKVDAIGLSGLITPSLEEMANVAKLLSKAGVNVPLMIGGATTSALHTAVKIAPLYGGPVLWIKDASQNAPALLPFLNPETRQSAFETLKLEQQQLREQNKPSPLVTFEEARSRKLSLNWD